MYGQMNPKITDVMTGVAAFFIGMAIVIGIVALVFYIFQAIGLYTMSKRRGYRYAWLSFVPIANCYVLGGITDNIEFCKGKKTFWRIAILITQAVSAVLGIIYFSYLFSVFKTVFIAAISGAMNGPGDFSGYSLYSMIPQGSVIFFFLFLVGTAASVLTYICLYKTFSDYTTSSTSVAFLLLSIFFGIQPFFLFALRKKPSKSLYYRFYAPQGGTPYGTPNGNYGVNPPYNAPVNPPYNGPVNPPYNAPVNPPYNGPVNSPYNGPVNPPYNAPVNPPVNPESANLSPHDDETVGQAPSEDTFAKMESSVDQTAGNDPKQQTQQDSSDPSHP